MLKHGLATLLAHSGAKNALLFFRVYCLLCLIAIIDLKGAVLSLSFLSLAVFRVMMLPGGGGTNTHKGH
jgi:hypothetical protein